MKNRSNLYLVVRNEWNMSFDGVPQSIHSAHVVGVYRTPQAADEVCGQYNQQVVDRKIPAEFNFEVQIGTYYDA